MRKSYAKYRKLNMFIGSLLIAILCVSTMQMGTYAALARPRATEIPLKSLIIGSYIIDFAAVSPTNVETATKTVESTGQDQMYYRSELTTGGLWINITNGSGVADILDSSETVVQSSEIDRLYLSHWIKNDGVAYELGSGAAKSFSQLNPLANPLVMDGMAPLDTERDKQVEILKNLDDDDDGYGTAKNKKAILDSVLALLNSSPFKAMDQKIDAIEASAAALRQNPAVEDSAIHAVDDALKNATIERELLYLNAQLAKLTNAGETAGTLDYGTLSDQIWTAHGKIAEQIRALEAESSGSAPATPLEAAVASAADKLADAAESGNIEAIQAAAEEKALSDQLALGLPVKTPEAVEILNDTLENAKNAAVLAMLKGTSFEYEAGKANGEGPSVLSDMLAEETEVVQEAMASWKDLVDMLSEALEDEVDQMAILAEYSEDLTSVLGVLPETDMKPKLLGALLDALEASQEAISEASADGNAVLQALLNDKDQQQAQLALINEAYADALENGDLNGADEIAAIAEQLVATNDIDAEAALDAYFDAKTAVEAAQDTVDAILEGQGVAELLGGIDDTTIGEVIDVDGDGVADGIDTNGDGIIDGIDTDGDGIVDGIDTDGDGIIDVMDIDGDGIADGIDTDGDGIIDVIDTDGDGIIDGIDTDGDGIADGFDTDGDGIVDGIDIDGDGVVDEAVDEMSGEVDMVALSDAISALGQARDALEEAKALLNPEDLQLIEAFLDLVDAVELYAEEGNGEMAASSAEALEALIPTLPEGMDVLSALADIISALNTAKAQAALEGDITGAQALAEAQMLMQETAQGDFAEAQAAKDTSAVDVLTGTVIVKPDGFIAGSTTYVGIKSLFDQIGGQAVWNPDQQKALGIANKTTLEIIVGEAIAKVGDEDVIMEGNTLLVDGRAYLPFNTVSVYIDKFLDERFDGLRVIILPNLIGE